MELRSRLLRPMAIFVPTHCTAFNECNIELSSWNHQSSVTIERMIKQTLKYYWRLARPHWRLWTTAFLLSLVFFVGLNIVMPWITSRFVARLSTVDSSTSIGDFMPLIAAWFVVRTAVFIEGRFQIRLHFKAQTRTLRDIDMASFDAIMAQGSDFFANSFTGSLVTKFNRFARSFETLANAAMYDLSMLLVQLIFPIGILLFIAPIMGVVLAVWAVIYAYFLVVVQRKKIPYSRDVAAHDSKITGAIADIVTNSLPVKMFARLPIEGDNFRAKSNERRRARYKNLIIGDNIRVYKSAFIIILQSIVFYLSAKFALDGTLDISQVVLIQFYILQLMSSLWEFGKLLEKLEEALADAGEMTEIYMTKPTIRDSTRAKRLGKVTGKIDLVDVHFTYEGDESQPVFSELDLHIPKGQKVGFVGPSGGGKTTLTKLLLRLMDVDAGKILLDGQDISKVTQDSLRSHIAYVPQEPLLFHRTIRENIRYGDLDASDEEVYEAARLAHAAEFIEKLPKGYETLVGERGIKLSGGQKQRVAIARAMLKKAPILVLDEATSALDSKSENLIVKALDALMKDRTTIVIAHRLSTIKKLDRIIVLTDQGVAEDGTHAELLKKRGIYYDLWSHQHDDFM